MNHKTILAAMALGANLAAPARAETKVWLCTGDFGMWAQDRAAMIQKNVNEAAPGKFTFETDQSFNFVKKLEAPNFAERFDVIVVGDVATGQMTTRAQEALARFVRNGGGLIYSMNAKSTIPFQGPRGVEPQPVLAVLPLLPELAGRLGAPETPAAELGVFPRSHEFFSGLDFTDTPGPGGRGGGDGAPLMLERLIGAKRGRSITIYGGMEAEYRYVSYANFEEVPNNWLHWGGHGAFWTRLLDRAAAASPVLNETRAAVDARVAEAPCVVEAAVDATKVIDDLRAANFSIVALQQLYNEDGGDGEADFLALNPRDWMDRRTQEVMKNTKGKYPDKAVLFREYNIQGVIMGDNSYGSYGGWDEDKWAREISSAVGAAKAYPGIITHLQAGNEPPLDQGFFDFYNRYMGSVLKDAPELKAMGPGCAWNIHAPPEREFKEFIEKCGKNLDVLNWHIYARPPSGVREQVLYWTDYAKGRLRTGAPPRVVFTEADTWNTRDSQFNYLLDRAFTFLPMPEISGCFQYCMRPRTEGGTYKFGVLMTHPNDAEFSANYNGYWIFRNLRGKMVEAKVGVTPAGASENCRVIASASPDGKDVTVVAYYDTGFYDGVSKSSKASVNISVKLPEGNYALEKSAAGWDGREAADVGGTFSGAASVVAELRPCHAVAWTWRRE